MLVVSQERFNFVKSKKNEYFPLFWGRFVIRGRNIGKNWGHGIGEKNDILSRLKIASLVSSFGLEFYKTELFL